MLSCAREIGLPPWTFVLAIYHLNIIQEIPISLHDICIVSVLCCMPIHHTKLQIYITNLPAGMRKIHRHEVHTSIANAFWGDTPKCSRAFKYGSGNGLARSHSLPMTRNSKKSVRPRAAIICSAFGRGAFVTAARCKPRSWTQLVNLWRPGTGSSCWEANLIMRLTS